MSERRAGIGVVIITTSQFAWDSGQQRVIDHDAGPLLYLGAPGTGTSTALAQAIARQVRRYGPTQVIGIAVGRPAIARLRGLVGQFIGSGVLPTLTSPHGLALGIVRAYGSTDERDEGEAQVRLLSGAEEDLRIRDLILGSVADATVPWPAELAAALPTLGFANEVRRFLNAYRAAGSPHVPAAGAGGLAGALVALAHIEQATAGLENIIDYAGLLELAEVIARREEVASVLPQRYRGVFVDDYHDLDSPAARLIDAVAGPDAVFIATADPAKQTLGFRGADPRVVGDFIDQRLGGKATKTDRVVIAEQMYRGDQHTLAATQSLLRTQPGQGLPAGLMQRLRTPRPRESADSHSSVQLRTYASENDLMAHVTEDIRSGHLDRQIPWSQFAVIARSSATITAMQRVLESQDIPAVVVADDLPLPQEPAVAHLLAVLKLAVDPTSRTAAEIADVVEGPFGALDPVAQRQLARAWRDHLRVREPHRVPDPYLHLQRDAIVAMVQDRLAGIPEELASLPAAVHLHRIGEVVFRAHQLIARGDSPALVLWELWNHSLADSEGLAWPERLQRSARNGHRSSDHDLDAVVALFATAQRLTERYSGVVGTTTFIAAVEGQRIAAESIGAKRGRRAEGVALMTVHQSRAQEWHTVFVLDAQEARWPNLALSTGVVDLDALMNPDTPRDFVAERADALESERRLFAVAITRAVDTTVVAAVDAGETEGLRPSRFIADLGVTPQTFIGRPVRPRTLAGLIGELRSLLIDPTAQPASQRYAAQQLAALAVEVDDRGQPIAAMADPDNWWHQREFTQSDHPINAVDAPVRLSASALAAIQTCPLQWFLDRHVRASPPTAVAAPIGQLVHVLAEGVARGEVEADPVAMNAWLDEVWPHLGISVPWHSLAQRQQVRRALDRLSRYLRLQEAAKSFSELPVVATINLRDLQAMLPSANDLDDVVEVPDDSIYVTGRIDRLEILDDGRGRIVDYKTSATTTSKRAAEQNLQLGLYQAAVLTGAVADAVRATGGEDVDLAGDSAGASLVYLGVDKGTKDPTPATREQRALTQQDDAGWLLTALSEAVRVIRAEDFIARTGPHCDSCHFVSMCPAQQEGIHT